MRLARAWVTAAMVAFLAVPFNADAQGRGKGASAKARSGRVTTQGSNRAGGNGPAFCRSGAGHPVFGWEWCRERGWDQNGTRPRTRADGRVRGRDRDDERVRDRDRENTRARERDRDRDDDRDRTPARQRWPS